MPNSRLPVPAVGLPRWPVAARLGAVLAVVVTSLACTAGIARADPAPEQWLPTGGDLVRTLRPCEMTAGAPAPPVCWAVSEDASAWMVPPAGSPYPWGQCTYYVGLMRADIWNDRAPPAADPLSDNWDAWTWAEHAQAEGLAVDGNPQPGDVMVYSRAAVGNQTGHVAMVDAVQPLSGSQVELTISEMNVDGLDNAALGQGDTMMVVVPRAQLVPGMIQFIHRPVRDYTPPAWPSGYAGAAGTVAVSASVASAAGNPSLTVGLAANQLETVSESTSPVKATVSAASTGTVVKRMSVPANRVLALGLPAGSYRVCVTQAPDGVWPAVNACATGAWQVPPSVVRLSTGRARSTAGGLRVPVAVAVRGPAPLQRVTALVTITARRAVRVGRRSVVRTVVLGRATVTLRRGRQVLRLGRALAGGPGVLHVRVLSVTRSGYTIVGGQVTCVVG